MADFTIRSDSVDVEQIMRHIRARIREKRGVDYTEQEIRELASAKLEKFLDPSNVRSEILQEFRRGQTPPPPLPNYEFGEETLFTSHRAPLRWLRRLMLPILKLFFFNPNPLIQALHIQSQVNARLAREGQEARDRAELTYEVMHNLVVELTRLAIEVKNLGMRVESLSSRLDFDERRARALEGVVQYRPTPAPSPASAADDNEDDQNGRNETDASQPGGTMRSRRRRRRRGSRKTGPAQPSSPETNGPAQPSSREANGPAQPSSREADGPVPPLVEEASAAARPPEAPGPGDRAEDVSTREETEPEQ